MVTRTLAGRRILLALACLFAFATSASAECAGECTDPQFAARQLFKLWWRKLGLLR
jgi:hypothetical protein